jgi:hypothetical protein
MFKFFLIPIDRFIFFILKPLVTITVLSMTGFINFLVIASKKTPLGNAIFEGCSNPQNSPQWIEITKTQGQEITKVGSIQPISKHIIINEK